MYQPGYLIVENVLSHRECDALSSELSPTAHVRSRAGARHLMGNKSVAELASDGRLLSIAALVLGQSAVPFRATLFDKSANANWLVVWHQDTALPVESRFASDEWGPWSTKAGIQYAHAPAWALNRIVALRVHLDPSTGDNGPLRIISGSHREGVLTDEQVFQIARTHNAVVCEVGRGGVFAMRPLLIHSSSKGQTADSRRVLHIEYADSLELKPGIRLAVA